jgi:SAM-dependent methyltransferase
MALRQGELAATRRAEGGARKDDDAGRLGSPGDEEDDAASVVLRPSRRRAVLEGYGVSSYGDGFADVYDDWYADVSDVDATVEAVAALAAGGAVLELGVGSGRLSLPLAATGLEVHGIDASPAMVERLVAKPGAHQVRVTVGDMADLDIDDPPPFAVVFAAFNTFFNLTTVDAQRRCLDRVAALLAPGGKLVIEAFVPDDPQSSVAVEPRHITADSVVLSVSAVDRDAQTVTGQHVHITEAGIRLRPWVLRYATPDQLDALAADAGLVLLARHEGWRGERFGPDSAVHVSTYGHVRDQHHDAQ